MASGSVAAGSPAATPMLFERALCRLVPRLIDVSPGQNQMAMTTTAPATTPAAAISTIRVFMDVDFFRATQPGAGCSGTVWPEMPGPGIARLGTW
jgi:hypothetical protein